MSGRGLRAAVGAAGAIATLAGLDTVVRGARSVAGDPRAGAALESELRFYSAFYVAYGIALLRVAPGADRDPGAVRALAAALFGAGLARAAAWRQTGAPHPAQRALLALELGLPPVAFACSEGVSRSGS
jgi:hypothetical protein